MKSLTIVNHNGEPTIDSREVAEMVEKQHKDLLRDIRGYCEILLSANLRSVNFFLESTYQDSTGRTLPRFLITRKRCDMVANKLTGEKGVLFTAAYVEKFHEMQQAPPLPSMTQWEIIAAIAQGSVELERKITALEARTETAEQRTENVERCLELVKGTIISRDDENWRTWIIQSINKIVEASCFLDHQSGWQEAYDLLEARANCDLAARLRNLRNRMRATGATKTKINGLRKLDVIEQESRLKEIFTGVIKEMLIRYVA